MNGRPQFGSVTPRILGELVRGSPGLAAVDAVLEAVGPDFRQPNRDPTGLRWQMRRGSRCEFAIVDPPEALTSFCRQVGARHDLPPMVGLFLTAVPRGKGGQAYHTDTGTPRYFTLLFDVLGRGRGTQFEGTSRRAAFGEFALFDGTCVHRGVRNTGPTARVFVSATFHDPQFADPNVFSGAP